MSRPPRPPLEAVITRRHGRLILLHGILMAVLGVAAFASTFGQGEDLGAAALPLSAP